MLGHTLHHVSSHYTAGRRKRSEKAWENGRKRRKNKGRERKGKRREQAGKTRAWRYALPNGRKGKNCNYAIRLSLTAKSVAEEMGISRQQLCNIEQSETAPVVVKYIAFLRSKGVDLNALFDRIIVNK